MLTEAHVEVGPNLKVRVFRDRNVYVKSSRGNRLNGSMEKITPSENDKSLIKYVISVLKKSGRLDKIASKDDTTTMDIEFKGGYANVNFDDGGSMKVPLKSASVYTEDVNYFPY